MLGMGGNDFGGWFKAAGDKAMIQTFHGYGNGRHLAPQIQAAGRENVFVSTGIPCGCCGSDSPKIQPMNASLAMGYIMDELSQLNTSYVDLLLFHHRCRTPEETASVWSALETAKANGLARHIGVSNFNTADLSLLRQAARSPIEVLEAHFGVGVMDFEVIDYAREHNIHLVSFSSLSEASTDLASLHPTVANIASAHNRSSPAIMYAYLIMRNITVLSTYHRKYLAEDLAIFEINLDQDEITRLDQVTQGKRTCPDCFTDECQACAQTLLKLGCPIGPLHQGLVWGRSNPNGTECMACASLSGNLKSVQGSCGGTGKGETLETMVPKACGI